MADPYKGILHGGDPFVQSDIDSLNDDLWFAFKNSGLLKKIVDKNIYADEVGTPSDFMKLYFIEMLIKYLCLYQADINANYCDLEEFEKLKESYKLKCIRNTFFCRYGYEKLFDELLSKLSNPSGGIGSMIVGGICNPFIVT
jgi:hypothetical protein